jgi:hypothetical protein
MSLDTLKRRSRSEAKSSDTRIHFLTERDLFWFEKLHRHGALPTEYLLAYSRHLGLTDPRARDRLTSLFHERKTPHGGSYLSRPEQQYATPVRNQALIHDLTPNSIQALKDAGRFNPHTPVHARGERFKHDFMRACITASLEIACLRSGKYEYLFHDVPLKGALRPDRLFAIRDAAAGRTIHFALEVDKGTEPLTTEFSRKSLMDNDKAYRDLIMSGDYREALGIDGGLLVMNVYTSETRMKNVMSMAKPSNFILYKTLPLFANAYFLTPPLFTSLLTDPWLRVEKDPFIIAKE